MKTSLILIIVLILVFGNCSSRQEFNLPKNFFDMNNKSPSEIEAVFGKSISIEKSEYSGNVYVYSVNKGAKLKVEYLSDKAKSFTFEFPSEAWITNPTETLKICRLELKISDAREDLNGLSWYQKSGEKVTSIISINKTVGYGTFYNCKGDFFD